MVHQTFPTGASSMGPNRGDVAPGPQNITAIFTDSNLAVVISRQPQSIGNHDTLAHTLNNNQHHNFPSFQVHPVIHQINPTQANQISSVTVRSSL
jgi:hypothetical protein